MSNASRRAILGGFAATTALGAIGTGRALARSAPTSSKPNVIFIMADDLGYADLSCTGSRHIKTPAIDSIRNGGVWLRNGYASAPICSPTRTALLTGRYQQRIPIGLEEPLGGDYDKDMGVPLGQTTIASAFKAMGYSTSLIGKWHLGDPPKHGPLAHGYDEFLGIVEGGADYFRHKVVMGGKEPGMGLTRNNDPVKMTGYLTDILGDEAVKVVERADNKPLFMSLHFNAPHWPWEGRGDAEAASKLNNFFHYDGGSIETYREMVEIMDQNVAKLLAALRRSGKLENTILIFTSDNGGERFSDTWPFTGVKGEVLEGGIRVPLLVSWPGQIKPGGTSDQVMASMDFMPTLLALAGGAASAQDALDGVDLSQQLLGKAAPVPRTLYWRAKANEQAAVRDGDWKYVKIARDQFLFNLANDSRERANLAGVNPAKLAELRGKWDAWNAQMLPYPIASFSEDVRNGYPDRY